MKHILIRRHALTLAHVLLSVSSSFAYLFNTLPICLFALIIHPSFQGLALAVLSLMSNFFFYSILQNLEERKNARDAIEIIKTFSLDQITSYNISDYIGNNQLFNSVISNYNFQSRLKKTKVIVIKKGGSGIVPYELKAFPLVDENIIFLRDDPSTISVMGMFFLYHEIGHCVFGATNIRPASVFTWKPYIFFVIWASININWNGNILLLSALCLFPISLVVFLSIFLGNELRFNNIEEINADTFALLCLNHDELQKVRDIFKSSRVFFHHNKLHSILEDVFWRNVPELYESRKKVLIKYIQSILDSPNNEKPIHNLAAHDIFAPVIMSGLTLFLVGHIKSSEEINLTRNLFLLIITMFSSIIIIRVNYWLYKTKYLGRLAQEEPWHNTSNSLQEDSLPSISIKKVKKKRLSRIIEMYLNEKMVIIEFVFKYNQLTFDNSNLLMVYVNDRIMYRGNTTPIEFPIYINNKKYLAQINLESNYSIFFPKIKNFSLGIGKNNVYSEQ